MEAKCSHCQTRPARIESNGLKCWSCYHVEQGMAGTEDWRDVHAKKYRESRDMIQRPDETPVNLYNRCKVMVMKSNFKFGSRS